MRMRGKVLALKGNVLYLKKPVGVCEAYQTVAYIGAQVLRYMIECHFIRKQKCKHRLGAFKLGKYTAMKFFCVVYESGSMVALENVC